MNLPQTKEGRDHILGCIYSSVESLKQIDSQRENIKDKKEEVFEKYDIKKADFQALVKAKYDESKMLAEIIERQTALSELNILTSQEE